MANVTVLLMTEEYQTTSFLEQAHNQFLGNPRSYQSSYSTKEAFDYMWQVLSQGINPPFQARINTNMILAKSVQITMDFLYIHCGTSSQGIYALDSEIVLPTNTLAVMEYCVATHGGAIALHGESYIGVGQNARVKFILHHAFQRGGTIYVSAAPGVLPVSNCFLQYDQDWEDNRGEFFFQTNTAWALGDSVYVSEVRNCFSPNSRKNFTTNLAPIPDWLSFSIFEILQFNFTIIYSAYDSDPWTALQWEIVSGINHMDIYQFG